MQRPLTGHAPPVNPGQRYRAGRCARSVIKSVVLFVGLSAAATAAVVMESGTTQRCFSGDGLPDHATGHFPNAGNPHRIRDQQIRLCVPAKPVRGRVPQRVQGSVGIALNGVQIRPGTADFYDPDSARGFSRNPASGWNLEGLGARELLGMDTHNAHVDERGLYHYHGFTAALQRRGSGTLVGYAADGFEIHALGPDARPSYRLRAGTRPTPPGGRFDGTYNEDWEYVAGSGTLDRCNGTELADGRYVYVATTAYPFFPRCLWGQASSDFQPGGPPAQAAGGATRDASGSANQRGALPGSGAGRADQRRLMPGPPPEAIAACSGQGAGSTCRFSPPGHHAGLTGTCRQTPQQTLACVPQAGRR